MKRWICLLALVAATTAATAATEHSRTAPPKRTSPKTPEAFNVMKPLAGEWKEIGKGEKGTKVRYELVADGTALVEYLNPGKPECMVTVYYPDGNRVMMTHFCTDGNQPRMVGTGTSKQMTFKMVDITNLEPGAGHMAGLTITFLAPDHITAAWLYEKGSLRETHTFDLERHHKKI
jgi:hypothetical protein